MAEKGYRIRAGINKEQWESADFPIGCEVCLGDNPYMKMTKKEFDRACKIWNKPMTVFRWRPGHKARFKKTEICQAWARKKNVCQTCIFDLDLGLPVAVVEKFRKDCEDIGVDPNEIKKGQHSDPEINDKLALLVKRYPSYKRNQAHICSFYVKGNCTRGANCPYRHEMPDEEEVKYDENGKKIKNLSVEQSIKNRFFGVNDGLANKMINKVKKNEKPSPPENKEISTIFIKGVEDGLNEEDIVEFFKKYGTVKGIRMRPANKCAFLCFEKRSAAEVAIDHLFGKLYIKERKLLINWAKDQLDPSKRRKRAREEVKNADGTISHKPAKIMIEEKRDYYQAMDPSRYGGSVKKREAKLERKEEQ